MRRHLVSGAPSDSRRTSLMPKINYKFALFCLLFGALSGTGAALAQVPPEPDFVSDSTWGVYTADPYGKTPDQIKAIFLGSAERVCLNLSSPKSCSNGSVIYGNPAGGGWKADLSSIPGAQWIWAPNVNGNTAKASLQFYYFSKNFQL